LYWNKYGTPDHILGKYNDEEAGPNYWWLDEFQAEDLKTAMKEGEELPAPERVVRFEDVFGGGSPTENLTEPKE